MELLTKFLILFFALLSVLGMIEFILLDELSLLMYFLFNLWQASYFYMVVLVKMKQLRSRVL